jgi:catalase
MCGSNTTGYAISRLKTLADAMRGTDPDHATRDLYDAIDRREFPSWTLNVQIMTPEQAEHFRF